MITPIGLPRGAALAAEFAEGARSFAAGFWFPTGSRHEGDGERGFAHFVEHMVFKGTGRRGAEELSRQVDRVGGYLNAFTDRDSICIHCIVPAGQWKLALDVLADMAFSSTFRDEDFERERDVIVSEILASRDDPEECSHDALLEAIWPGDRMSRTITGEPEDLSRAEPEGLRGFYRSRLQPASLLATAAGPVAPQEVAEELGRILEGLGERPAPAVGAESSPRFQPIAAYVPARIGQVHYYEATQLAPPFTARDYYALSALNGAIGEASSSRLFVSLRERAGLCYSVYSAFSMTRTECLWIASASSSARDLPRLAGRMSDELARLASGGLSDQECFDAVERLSGSFAVALDDVDYRMRRIGRQVLFGGAALDPEETQALLSGISRGEIADMARRLLGGARARFAYGRRSLRAAAALGLELRQPRRGARGD